MAKNQEDKSDEYRLRRCVVLKLLNEGWTRQNIRLEIPMSTASSGGRADIVLLDDSYTACIELKSGRDKLESELLATQMSQYRRSFDKCAVIADASLYRRVEVTTQNSTSYSDNFRNVDLAYKYNWFKQEGTFQSEPKRGYSKEEPPEIEKIMPVLFPPWHGGLCRYTSVIDMAQILWAEELRSIFGGKGTKSGLEVRAKEEMSVKQFRPLLISALRLRPLNEWEAKFWERFDNPEQKPTMKEMIAQITK